MFDFKSVGQKKGVNYHKPFSKNPLKEAEEIPYQMDKDPFKQYLSRKQIKNATIGYVKYFLLFKDTFTEDDIRTWNLVTNISNAEQTRFGADGHHQLMSAGFLRPQYINIHFENGDKKLLCYDTGMLFDLETWEEKGLDKKVEMKKYIKFGIKKLDKYKRLSKRKNGKISRVKRKISELNIDTKSHNVEEIAEAFVVEYFSDDDYKKDFHTNIINHNNLQKFIRNYE